MQFWDVEGFNSCEGVTKPLRVLHTVETTRRRQHGAKPPSSHLHKPKSAELRNCWLGPARLLNSAQIFYNGRFVPNQAQVG